MTEKYYKYAKLLLINGLCIRKNQPLVINAPIESIEFIRILTKVACELGVEDIYYDSYDDGYDDIYMNDDYDYDRYYTDSDYANGVDDAMDDFGEDW